MLLFIFRIVTYGQLKETFASGVIELQNHQTIKGFIKADELPKMNYKIYFKSLLSDKKVTAYDTAQIKSFNLNGNEFFELLHIRVNNIEDSVSIFAKLILRGRASLFKTVFNSEIIYIIKNNDNLYVLQNDELESNALAVTSHNFRQHLTWAVSGVAPANNELQTISFNEKDFVRVISAYNHSSGSENKLTAVKEKPVHFVLANFGGRYATTTDRELFIQLLYRTYVPKISRSASVNVGIHYFNLQYSKTDDYGFYSTIKYYTSTLVSLPFQFQLNILNKNIRPYVFAGTNACYYKVVDEKGASQIREGFQNNFGIGLLYGGGIEADIYKGLTVKSEYRYEIYSHNILCTIGYVFSKR